MKKIALIATTVLAIAMPLTALATPFSIEDTGGTLGLGTADLKATVINIIQWVLGLLALVAVIMIIIGGFQWMTAAGNEEKIEKAKKVISAAVIGLIIVLLAWAIVIFVANTTKNVTT
jgi:type IV secretory pathway VirB2 component (pilin)